MYSVHRYLCGWCFDWNKNSDRLRLRERMKEKEREWCEKRKHSDTSASTGWTAVWPGHNWLHCVCVFMWEVYELCVWGLLVNIFNTRRIQPQYKAIKYFKPHALQRLSHPIQKPSWSSKWGGIFRSRLGNKSSTTTTTVYTASWRSGCNNNNNSACICVSVSGANVSEATATASVCGQRLSLDLYFVLSLSVYFYSLLLLQYCNFFSAPSRFCFNWRPIIIK